MPAAGAMANHTVPGDVVSSPSGLYLALKDATRLHNSDAWARMQGTEGGLSGGGGGGGGLTTLPPMTNIQSQSNHILMAPGNTGVQLLEQMTWLDARQIDQIVPDLAARMR